MKFCDLSWRPSISSVPLVPPPSRSPSDLDVLIGARLRLARKLRWLSQGRLADILGITFQQIQKYEAGRNRVSAVSLSLMADKLGVPITYFYEDFGLVEGNDGEAAFSNHRQLYVMTTEGRKLIDTFRASKPGVRGAVLSLLQAVNVEEQQTK